MDIVKARLPKDLAKMVVYMLQPMKITTLSRLT